MYLFTMGYRTLQMGERRPSAPRAPRKVSIADRNGVIREE
jgi:hypothetical protein